MNYDLADKREPIAELSIQYRMLLGQYCRDWKEVRKRESREGLHILSDLWTGRLKLTDSILPEGRKSGQGGPLDQFGCNVVYRGGLGTFQSLWALDQATVAAFIEWNRINIVRTERLLLLRRAVAFLIALLGVIASAHEIFNKVPAERMLTIVAELHWWLFAECCVGIALVIIIEFALWRPRKSRLEEFGQILAVAFAYISKSPSSGEDKSSDHPLPKAEH